MKKVLISALISGAMIVSANAQAGDAEAGKKKADSCVSCHGMNGKSSNPMYPNLAGQKKPYLVKALKAYRDGKRDDPMMSSFAKPLTDEDIENLATYYAGIK